MCAPVFKHGHVPNIKCIVELPDVLHRRPRILAFGRSFLRPFILFSALQHLEMPRLLRQQLFRLPYEPCRALVFNLVLRDQRRLLGFDDTCSRLGSSVGRSFAALAHDMKLNTRGEGE